MTQEHYTLNKAVIKAIELSKKIKSEVIVWSRNGEEFHYTDYGDYGLPDSYVIKSFVNGEEIDFGLE